MIQMRFEVLPGSALAWPRAAEVVIVQRSVSSFISQDPSTSTSRSHRHRFTKRVASWHVVGMEPWDMARVPARESLKKPSRVHEARSVMKVYEILGKI